MGYGYYCVPNATFDQYQVTYYSIPMLFEQFVGPTSAELDQDQFMTELRYAYREVLELRRGGFPNA
jgi:hypothetical protein